MDAVTDKRLRLLIVDDEVLTLKALQRLLRQHDTTSTASGYEALELAISARPYDAIVCDIMMPEMTGVEVFQRLRAVRPGLERTIVFVSGGAFGSDILKFLADVPNAIVPKPFDKEKLLSAVRSAAQQVASLDKVVVGPV